MSMCLTASIKIKKNALLLNSLSTKIENMCGVIHTETSNFI
jgi:hypothetical protein